MIRENSNNELTKKLRGIGKQMVLKALKKYNWNLEKTAKDLRITKAELLELMKRYEITSPEV